MKKIILVLLIIIMTSFITFSNVKEYGQTIIVGIDNNYPPYEYLISDVETGFNVDLIKAVAEVMNLNIEFKADIWDKIRSDLVTGDVDVLAGMYQSSERDKVVDFSTVHVKVAHAIFTRTSSPIHDMADAKDKIILVQNGDLMHDYLIENKITDRIIPVADQEEAIVLLSEGKADMAILNKFQAYYFINKNEITNVKTVGQAIIQRDYCFAVKEGNQDLQTLLNEGLGIIKSTGEYDRIYNKWFAIYHKEENAGVLKRYFTYIGLPMVVAILLISLWSWTLKREVSKKTQALEASLVQVHTAQSQAIQNEKMAALGRMVAGITHEISTPLGVIRTAITSADMQVKKVADAFNDNKLSKSQLVHFLNNDRETLEIVMNNLKTTINHLESFKVLAVDQMNEQARKIHIGSYIEEVLLNLKPKLKKTHHQVMVGYEEDYLVYTYPGAISQIITNLVTNSLRYGFEEKDQGLIQIKITLDETVIISYQDDGCGISLEDQGKIYEPFFTRGLDKGGSGLGMNIVYNLVTKTLQGKIKLESQPGQGVLFTIEFPNK